MATTKFYLDLRGKAKDGKGSVQVQLYHNGTTAYFPTGIRLTSQEWNGTMAVRVTGAETINANLQEQKTKIDKFVALLSFDDRYKTMTASDIKSEFGSAKPRKIQGHSISEVFAEYMNSGNLKEGTKDIYRTTLRKVQRFKGDVKIESIDLKWLRGFDAYLAKTQGVNGRSIFLRSLRAVCNYALHTGIVSTYPFAAFQIRQEETSKRSVSRELLQQFKSYATSDSNAVYRDYFFLMFYLIGVNTKDLLLARKSQVNEGRFDYIREKTGKKYSVKIEPEAEELLKRYEGKGDYLLEAMDHCKNYRSFAHQINDALKLIGEEYTEEIPDMDNLFGEPTLIKRVRPVIPGITTYYARHTWATLAYEAGVPLDIISQALGHSFGNRTTLIYVKFDQNKIDEANRKVLDYFKQAE